MDIFTTVPTRSTPPDGQPSKMNDAAVSGTDGPNLGESSAKTLTGQYSKNIQQGQKWDHMLFWSPIQELH